MQLDQSGPIAVFDCTSGHFLLTKRANAMLTWAKSHLPLATFPSCNYKELCALIVTYFSEELPGNYWMRHPGAIN